MENLLVLSYPGSNSLHAPELVKLSQRIATMAVFWYTKNMKKTILVLFGGTAIIVGGLFVYDSYIVDQRQDKEERIQESLTQEIVKDLGINIADWQTYRNDEFGFQMKYPEEWEVKEFETKIDIGIFGLPKHYFVTVSKSENPEGLNGKQYAQQWLRRLIRTLPEQTIISTSTEAIEVGGYGGSIVRDFHIEIEDEPNLDVIFVVLPDQELIYQIQFPIGEGQLSKRILDPEKNYRTANQILSTFQFIK